MRILHIGKPDSGIVLAGIFKIECVSRQENQIIVEILGDSRRTAVDELIDRFAVVRGNPARELEFCRAPVVVMVQVLNSCARFG